MNDLTNKKIRFSDAAHAIGVTNKALRNWFQRNEIHLISDHTGAKWTEFTFGDVAVLAVMRTLVKWGISVDYANEIAFTELATKAGPLFQYRNTPAEALIALFKQWDIFLFDEDENGDPKAATLPAQKDLPRSYADFLFLNLGLTIETAFKRLDEKLNQ